MVNSFCVLIDQSKCDDDQNVSQLLFKLIDNMLHILWDINQTSGHSPRCPSLYSGCVHCSREMQEGMEQWKINLQIHPWTKSKQFPGHLLVIAVNY